MSGEARLLLNGRNVGFVSMDDIKFERESGDTLFDDLGNQVRRTRETTIKIDGINQDALRVFWGGAPPIRIMAGINQDIKALAALTKTPLLYIPDEQHLHFQQTPQQKETTMPIHKKKFHTWTNTIDAEDLGQRHIGDLVTVTTVDGVKITDVLTGLAVGSPWGDSDNRFVGKVYVVLEHVGSPDQYGSRLTGVFLEPLSRVTIKPRKSADDE